MKNPILYVATLTLSFFELVAFIIKVWENRSEGQLFDIEVKQTVQLASLRKYQNQ